MRLLRLMVSTAMVVGLATASNLWFPQQGLGNDLDARLAKASMLIDGKHLPEARRILEPICDSEYATPAALCMLSDTYLEWVDTDDETPGAKAAERGLVRALYMDPQWGRAYKNLAEFANLREDWSSAAFLASMALMAKTPDYYALKQRAIAYSHLNKQAEALADISLDIKFHPEEQMNYLMKAGILRTLKRYDEAAACCRIAMSKEGISLSDATQQLLNNLVSAKKYDDAIAVATQIIKNNKVPQSVDFFIRAKVEHDAKKYPQAIADLSKAISIDRVSKYFKLRAEIYAQMGRKDLADKDLHDAEHDNF